MSNLDPTPVAARRPIPRWAAAVVVLQSVTLLAVLAARPAVPSADAAQVGSQRGAQDEGRQGLPNAAEQRAQQIRVLGQIHDELVKVNQKLDRVNDQLKTQQQAKPAGQ